MGTGAGAEVVDGRGEADRPQSSSLRASPAIPPTLSSWERVAERNSKVGREKRGGNERGPKTETCTLEKGNRNASTLK